MSSGEGLDPHQLRLRDAATPQDHKGGLRHLCSLTSNVSFEGARWGFQRPGNRAWGAWGEIVGRVSGPINVRGWT